MEAVGQVSVTMPRAFIDEHVCRAVHRFKRANLLAVLAFDEGTYFLLKCSQCPEVSPETTVVDERCTNFLIPLTEIEFPHFFRQVIIDERTFRKPKRTAPGIRDASERVLIRVRVCDGRVLAASSRCVKYA